MNTDPDGGSNRPKTVTSSAAGDPVPRLSGVHAITEASTIITRTSLDDTNLFSSPSWALRLSLLSEPKCSCNYFRNGATTTRAPTPPTHHHRPLWTL